MKFLKKLIISSLVVTLVSFAGGFCMHPMQVEAAAFSTLDMSLVHMDENGTQIMQVGDASAVALSPCVFDCISKAPQATATKKTSLDSALSVVAIISQAGQSQPFDYFSYPLDGGGPAPPFPDILFSVVKIE